MSGVRPEHYCCFLICIFNTIIIRFGSFLTSVLVGHANAQNAGKVLTTASKAVNPLRRPRPECGNAS